MAEKLELTDEELNEVNGGLSQFKPENIGSWLSPGRGSEFVFRIQNAYFPTVTSSGQYVWQAAILEKYWCNGSEAWYYGTVTEDYYGRYYDIIAPATVHKDRAYIEKPF